MTMHKNNSNKRTKGRKEKKIRGKDIQRKQSKFFFPPENSTLKLPISIHTLSKEPDTQLFSQTLRMALPPDITPKPPLQKFSWEKQPFRQQCLGGSFVRIVPTGMCPHWYYTGIPYGTIWISRRWNLHKVGRSQGPHKSRAMRVPTLAPCPLTPLCACSHTWCKPRRVCPRACR